MLTAFSNGANCTPGYRSHTSARSWALEEKPMGQGIIPQASGCSLKRHQGRISHDKRVKLKTAKLINYHRAEETAVETLMTLGASVNSDQHGLVAV